MRILIFGASGFIGSNLSIIASKKGYEVLAFCRSGEVKGFDGKTIRWSLGDDLPESVIRGADCAIHLAHDFSDEQGAKITFDATLKSIREINSVGVPKQIFFSSYSAGEHAKSLYGRTKHELERELKEIPSVTIVRPGLVIGEGGIYGRISKWSKKLPIIPLPNSGDGVVPVISIDRLCLETINIFEKDLPSQEINLFEKKLKTLRNLVLDAARKVGKRPLIFPLPAFLFIMGLKLAALIRIPLPVNADNLSGFLGNQQAEHRSTLNDEL